MSGPEVHVQDDAGTPTELDVLRSHDDSESRRWWSRPTVVLGLVLLAVVAAANAVGLVRDAVADRAWPSGCGVEGHPDWCEQPSDAMRAPDLAALARSHCPALAALEPREVVPQPLDPIGPRNSDVLARTSGTVQDGSEDALLGQPGRLAWITRELGGRDDGEVRISCLGDTRSTPGLLLAPDQLRSSFAAAAGEPRRVDLTEVARQLMATARQRDDTGVSFGFFSCDTASLDLTRLQVGRTFSCAVEVYGWHGLGAYRATYRLTSEVPYFAPVGTT